MLKEGFALWDSLLISDILNDTHDQNNDKPVFTCSDNMCVRVCDEQLLVAITKEAPPRHLKDQKHPSGNMIPAAGHRPSWCNDSSEADRLSKACEDISC